MPRAHEGRAPGCPVGGQCYVGRGDPDSGATVIDDYYEGREHEEQEDATPEAAGTSEDTYVTIEISSLSVFTHHGASSAEREVGQRLVFDISLDLDECDAVATDRL